MAHNIHKEEIRKGLSTYKPGATQKLQGHRYQRVCLQLFGLSGQGKSSLINTCLGVVQDREYMNVTECLTTDICVTLKRHEYALGPSLYIIDNRGLSKLDNVEKLEMAAQFADLRVYGQVKWDQCLDSTFDKICDKFVCCRDDVIVPVFVYSSKYGFTRRRAAEISPFLTDAGRFTGIFPVIVLTHCENIDTEELREEFIKLGASYITVIENYTPEKPWRNAKTDAKILEFLDVCTRKADGAIAMKWQADNQEEYLHQAMRMIKSLLNQETAPKDCKIKNLKHELKVQHALCLHIEAEKDALEEEMKKLGCKF